MLKINTVLTSERGHTIIFWDFFIRIIFLIFLVLPPTVTSPTVTSPTGTSPTATPQCK